MSELEVQSILNSNSWLESYEIAIVESQSWMTIKKLAAIKWVQEGNLCNSNL